MEAEAFLEKTEEWMEKLECELERSEEARESELDDRKLKFGIAHLRRMNRRVTKEQFPTVEDWEGWHNFAWRVGDTWPWDCAYTDALLEFERTFKEMCAERNE